MQSGIPCKFALLPIVKYNQVSKPLSVLNV